jgi:OmcA/MtrC family decaheme c-type cytochrome
MKTNPFVLKRFTAGSFILLGLLLLLAACSGRSGSLPDVVAGPPGVEGARGPEGPAGPAGPQGPPGPAGASFSVGSGPGLQMKITEAKFPDGGSPIITVEIKDSAGHPLPAASLEGFGFTVAQIVVDENTGLNKVQSLLLREVEGQPYTFRGEEMQPVLARATQAFADTTGAWEDTADGKSTYTFANTLSLSLDPTLPTMVGVYASKDNRAFVANDVFTFIPDSGEPGEFPQIVTTEACLACHNPLALHGGTRREVPLCLTCHTDQTIDPETGNTVDFKVMIHRIHAGANLPSVQAGEPYHIVGFRQSVFDFSMGVWPQDIRNCETCHTGSPQSEAFMTSPSTASCLSCHDNVNLITGENHPGGSQTDARCSACHIPSGQEFDASVAGAHTIPVKSSSIRGVNFEILDVDGAVPGGSPSVTFKITDNSGQVIAPDEMDVLSVTMAGPTSDYVNRVTETIFRMTAESTGLPDSVQDLGNGSYKFTFTTEIPAEETGTYAFALEGYVNESIRGLENPVRVAGFNPVAYAALGEGSLQERRQVVDQQSCSACHQDLALHGGQRQNVEYCVMCHNPTASDEARRPEEAMPPVSINLKSLVHSIHKGKSASQPVIFYGFGGNEYNFSNVVFPGNLAECQTCHLPNTYGLPLPTGVQPTMLIQAGELLSTTGPIAATCSSCHDTQSVAGHIELATTEDGVETCQVCHGPGKDKDVYIVHP